MSNQVPDLATCGTCRRTWDDAKVTNMTPAPAARCPFEYFHGPGETVPANHPVQPIAPADLPSEYRGTCPLDAFAHVTAGRPWWWDTERCPNCDEHTATCGCDVLEILRETIADLSAYVLEDRRDRRRRFAVTLEVTIDAGEMEPADWPWPDLLEVVPDDVRMIDYSEIGPGGEVLDEYGRTDDEAYAQARDEILERGSA